MTLPAVIFTLLSAIFLLGLPRPLAPLPLLIGASYMTLGQQILIGPFNFTVIRILVAIGVLRVIMRKEQISGGWNALDRLLVCWGAWAVFSSVFHEDFSSTLIGHLGLAYDTLGLYFLLRIFIQNTGDILTVSKIVILVLIPVAGEMVLEALTGRNSFSFLGGVSPLCEIRDGKIRAQGPFAGSIPAGTVGAVCLPMALLLWQRNRKLALLGLLATASMVITSRSSGPIMTAAFVLLGMALWKVRRHMRLIRWGAVLGIVALAIVMNAPVYYLIARIDLTGSSTGYHRAALIEAAISHLDEWWLAGTDYTRHWMPYGIAWSAKHTDITNQYIKMGVLGGLPLLLLFIGILHAAFSSIGKALRLNEGAPPENEFIFWTLGSILFGHAVTFLTINYYDQSAVFLYVLLASIGSLPSLVAQGARADAEAPPGEEAWAASTV